MTGPTPQGDIVRLHQLRALMASLKEEEAQLRARLLTLRDGVHDGPGGIQLKIMTSTSRRLDRAAIPENILANPAFWKETSTRYVRILKPEAAIDPLLERA